MTRSEAHKGSRRGNAKLEEAKWQELCRQYLPVDPVNSKWRYSRPSQATDPTQGWKLHISATILCASQVLQSIAPYLKRQRVQFKAPCTLLEVDRLNSGLHYGYAQIGKVFTVYSRRPTEAVRLARQLHRLTRDYPAPMVPFDRKYRSWSSVHYRYGSFIHREMEHDGAQVPALCDPDGRLVPDFRESNSLPPWVDDPFATNGSARPVRPYGTPLGTTYGVFQSLTQRGKGGVYKAFDFSVEPPRLCLLKEGRAGGEVRWDGRDGGWLVRRERQALTALRKEGIPVPAIYSSFQADSNEYLVTEFIAGESLQSLLWKRRKRLSMQSVMNFALDLTALIAQIHDAGWLWRDCKPANLIVAKDGKLSPIDFEGACRIDNPDPLWWSTPAFTPSELNQNDVNSPVRGTDLYALGAVFYFLLTGRLPEGAVPEPVKRLRRGVPHALTSLIDELLGSDSRRRPEAEEILRRLRSGVG
jgi:serine/threonine protein kinase